MRYNCGAKLTEQIQIKKPQLNKLRFTKRSLADSNRRRWFCRPLPSHSAKRPYLFCFTCANIQCFIYKLQIYIRKYLK